MLKIKHFTLIVGAAALLFTSTINANGFIKKEVYSYKDASGNLVFTDKQPEKKQSYKTQTIEAASSTGNSQNSGVTRKSYQPKVYSSASYEPQTVRVIIEDGNLIEKKKYKKRRSLKRCKSFKKRFDYYSDKMNSGYKNSEYKKLEKQRKKYRDLLFKNCDTRTFAD